MNRATPSTKLFFGLLVFDAILAAIAAFLPQGFPEGMPESTLPILQVALISSASILIFYGGLGWVGLRLTRKLGYPDLLDTRVTNRQRFLTPMIVGLWMGLLFIVADNLFSRFHSYGTLPHPAFPLSIVASLTAGIGEEIMFRLFFIPVLVWLISRVVLKGGQERVTFWNAAIFSGMFFAAGHLPSLMMMLGAQTLADIPPAMMAEVFLLNGALSLVAAYFLRKSGYLAAVTVHTSTDIVWHVIWGLVR